ncbi:hypothetical protein LNTAR_03144 [Lentisphaera araneosa HTCC2155]|uniref:NAD-dependent epimerase/dehydratase domain-containing protein n=1 Tax=Lentisphaera araneosa HTCC2155 TaxID=313628 RepID=A6DT16_9BACT|nr:NAD-dependent epimerase/dehydratase family protein [Lentisphaera araneosa]EDM25191.1 hypothetical protein LNTAR_03144 [Lentisphaera araneosa HTCC2155]
MNNFDVNNCIVQADIEGILASGDFSNFKNKNILISGANGFLPAYIVDVLMHLNIHADYNINIYAVCRTEKNFNARLGQYLEHDNFHLVIADISLFYYHDNKDFLPEQLDFIIHAASFASPKYYGKIPVDTLLPNIIGTKNLLDIAIKTNCESFLLFSSGEVYGQIDTSSITERDYGYIDPLDVRSCYAESKRMGENICISYSHQYDLNVKIIRPFHTYGPGMKLDDGRVFSDFVSNIVNNEDIELHSDGSAVRPFCYIADAVAAFFLVLSKGENKEAYNIANPYELKSIKELAETLVSLFKEKNLKLQFKKITKKGYIPSHLKTQVPSITKIEALGWSPMTSVKEGFSKTVRSYN